MSMTIKEFMAMNAVFRYEEFKHFMQERGVQQDASIRQALSYHCRHGKLLRIRRSLYAVNPELSAPKEVDPYLVAAYATPQAVIAYHTALELHNLAYTTFSELTYLAHKPVTDFSFQGQHFRSTQYPKALIDKKQQDYATESITREGRTIRLTSLERTLVDILDRPDLGGGWEEVVRSWGQLVNFNQRVMVNYTLLLDKASTAAKVGYFLENHLPDYVEIDKAIILKLLAHIPKQPYYLNPSRKSSEAGDYISKWQLIVPHYITKRQWEEPDGDII